MSLAELAARMHGAHLDGVSLKGPRTYLHSTDLWNALERLFADEVAAAPGSRMSTTFRRLTARRLQIVPAETVDLSVRFGDVRLTCNDEVLSLALAETGETVTGRVTCPEAAILPEIVLGEQTASVPARGAGTPVERLVAATRTLHLRQVDAGVKWLVGRLDLAVPFAHDARAVEVKIARRLPRGATISSVSLDGAPVGEIYFNMMRQA